MNAKLRQAVILNFTLSLVLFASCSYGQAAPLDNPQILQAQLDQLKQLAATWKVNANVEFSLAMAVVILGAVVALLQKVDGKKWCSVVVMASGIVISALTYGTKEYFEVDHKTYRKNAEAATREIKTAESYLKIVSGPGIDSESRQTLLQNVAKSIAKINSIADGAASTSSLAADSDKTTYLLFIGAAYAQPSSRPAWVSQTRVETATSYRFVGASTAASVAAAESQARISAQRAAASGLSIPLDTVTRYSVLVDTYFEYDAGRRTYLCYARVELNKAFVHR